MPSGSPSPRFAKVTSCSGTRRASMSSIITAASATEAALTPGPAGRNGQSAAKRPLRLAAHRRHGARAGSYSEAKPRQLNARCRSPGEHTGTGAHWYAARLRSLHRNVVVSGGGLHDQLQVMRGIDDVRAAHGGRGDKNICAGHLRQDAGKVCAQLWHSNRLSICAWKRH